MSKLVPHEKDAETIEEIKHGLREAGMDTHLETFSRLSIFPEIPFPLNSTHVVHGIDHLPARK